MIRCQLFLPRRRNVTSYGKQLLTWYTCCRDGQVLRGQLAQPREVALAFSFRNARGSLFLLQVGSGGYSQNSSTLPLSRESFLADAVASFLRLSQILPEPSLWTADVEASAQSPGTLNGFLQLTSHKLQGSHFVDGFGAKDALKTWVTCGCDSMLLF